MADEGVPVILRILVKKDQDLAKTTEEIKAAVQDIFNVKATSDPFEDLKVKAQNALASLEVTRSAIQQTFGSDSDANLALLEGITRDLQVWQAYNGELIKQNPELRDAYRGTYQEAKARIEEVSAALQAQAKAAQSAARDTAAAEKSAYQEVAQAAKETSEVQKEASNSARDAARAAAQEVATNARLVQQLGTTLGLAMSAAGAGLLGIAGAAVKSAADFEQLEVRLAGVRGSAEGAAKALELVHEYAGQKGFELKGLEEAAVKVEQFGLRTEQVLGTVADLAAVKGKTLEGTAQVLGLIAEGDERVFRTLSRQYQITATDLRQYGAVVDDVKGKVINNTETAEQNVKALQRLVAAKWGDASAKQADTMTGAFNQAHNQVTLLSNAFGKELEPFVVGALKSVSGLAGFVNSQLTPGMKELGIISAVVGGVLLTAAGSATLLGTALFVVNAQLTRMAATSPLAAQGLSLLNTVQTSVVEGLGAFLSRGLALITSTGGMVGALAALAAAYGTHEINAYIESQEKLGKAIEGSGKKAVDASQQYHKLNDVLGGVAKAHNIELNLRGDAQDQLKAIDSLFGKVANVDIVQAADAAGYSMDVVKQKLAGFADQSKVTTDQIAAVTRAIKALQDVPPTDSGTEARRQIAEDFHKVGLDAYTADLNVKSLQGVLSGFTTQSKELEVSIGIFKRLAEAIGEVDSTFTKALEGGKRLKEYLKFAEQVDSAQSLTAALGQVEERLRVLGNLDGLKGKSKQQLLDQLLDPKTSDAVKAATEQYFEFDHVKEQILQKDKKRQDDAVKEQLRQDHLLFDEKRALGQATLSDELEMIQKELANYKLSTEEKIRLEEKAAQLRKQIPEEQGKKDELAFRHLKTLRDTSLQEELAFVQAEQKLFEEGSAQRIAFEEKEAQIRKQIQLKAVKDAKEALTAQYESAREVVDKVKVDAEHTPAQAIKAIDGVVGALQKWKAANAQVLASSAELRKEFDSLVRSTNASRAQEVTKQYADNLRILKESLTQFSAEAVGENQKLLAVDKSIELVKRAQTTHLITQKQAEVELSTLGKQRLAVEEKITEQKASQAIKLANLEVQAREKELQVLEKRQGRGEHLESQTKKSQDGLFTARLAALDKETAEQVRKAGGAQDQITVITKEAALKRQEIVQSETERQVEEYEKRKKAFESHQKQMEDLASGKKGKKGLGFSGFGEFSIADFGEDFETSDRYKRGQDSTFLGDDAARGFGGFGDDGNTSPAALYRTILAKLSAQAGKGPNPIVPSLESLEGFSKDPMAALLKGGAISPQSFSAKQQLSVFDEAHKAAIDTAFKAGSAVRDWKSNGNAANGMPGSSSNANSASPVAAGVASASGATVHLHIDGKSGQVEERDIVRSVTNWLEREGYLRGANQPPL